jgi:hypothetical protein
MQLTLWLLRYSHCLCCGLYSITHPVVWLYDPSILCILHLLNIHLHHNQKACRLAQQSCEYGSSYHPVKADIKDPQMGFDEALQPICRGPGARGFLWVASCSTIYSWRLWDDMLADSIEPVFLTVQSHIQVQWRAHIHSILRCDRNWATKSHGSLRSWQQPQIVIFEKFALQAEHLGELNSCLISKCGCDSEALIL